MCHLTACKISVSLSFFYKKENAFLLFFFFFFFVFFFFFFFCFVLFLFLFLFFYRASELMLATLIQGYNKKNISFQERETNCNFTGCQVPHFMIVSIPYINLLNFSWIIKCLFLRNMEPLRKMRIQQEQLLTQKQ